MSDSKSTPHDQDTADNNDTGEKFNVDTGAAVTDASAASVLDNEPVT